MEFLKNIKVGDKVEIVTTGWEARNPTVSEVTPAYIYVVSEQWTDVVLGRFTGNFAWREERNKFRRATGEMCNFPKNKITGICK
jgi:hypothetical protein